MTESVAESPMRPGTPLHLVSLLLLSGCTASTPRPDNAALQREVADTERTFAHSMAARNFDAFSTFISDDALFYSGGKPTRGKAAVTAKWKPYFDKPEAPFSWEPDQVDVVDSGTLAMSTGPVYDHQGKLIGRFRSVWRQESPGQWRIVFDKGENSCEPAH